MTPNPTPTATELYALVKDLPREAWPMDVYHRRAEGGYSEHWTIDNGSEDFCKPDHAVLMFEASCLRLLMLKSSEPVEVFSVVVENSKTEYVVRWSSGWDEKKAVGDSLLSALVAAAKEAK